LEVKEHALEELMHFLGSPFMAKKLRLYGCDWTMGLNPLDILLD
jgi:hypothetical protein